MLGVLGALFKVPGQDAPAPACPLLFNWTPGSSMTLVTRVQYTSMTLVKAASVRGERGETEID